MSVGIESFLILLGQIGDLDEPVGLAHGLVIMHGMGGSVEMIGIIINTFFIPVGIGTIFSSETCPVVILGQEGEQMVGHKLVDGIVPAGIVTAGRLRGNGGTMLLYHFQYLVPVGHPSFFIQHGSRNTPVFLEYFVSFCQYSVIDEMAIGVKFGQILEGIVIIFQQAVSPGGDREQTGEDAQVIDFGYQARDGGRTGFYDMVDDVDTSVVGLHIAPQDTALVIETYRTAISEVSELHIQMGFAQSGDGQETAVESCCLEGSLLSHVNDADVDYLSGQCLGNGVQGVVAFAVVFIQIGSDGFVVGSEDGIVAVDAQQTSYSGKGAV